MRWSSLGVTALGLMAMLLQAMVSQGTVNPIAGDGGDAMNPVLRSLKQPDLQRVLLSRSLAGQCAITH